MLFDFAILLVSLLSCSSFQPFSNSPRVKGKPTDLKRSSNFNFGPLAKSFTQLPATVQTKESFTTTITPSKRVYEFKEGSANEKSLLGNKGANLCEMTRLGLPVPPGFVITTEACLEYFDSGKTLPLSLEAEYIEAIFEIENKTGRKFGATGGFSFPLLLSIRSGAAASMPG